MLVKNLKVLHMEKPLGIDVVPYFLWVIESDIPNTIQISYQLEVAYPDHSTEIIISENAVKCSNGPSS